MGKQSFDRKIEQIRALRSAPEESAQPQLCRALKDRSNYVVAQAASVTADRRLQSLVPDLLAAFDRFMVDPVKADPQCWAKIAIAKALKELDHSDPAVFLRGMAHVQLEPVWGKPEDSAATLRGTCALALVGCHIPSFEILTHLTDLLADAKGPVRIDAARAIAQLSAREGVLPLRLKVLAGDPEPEVVGECFAALLSLAPVEYLSFVAGFLHSAERDRVLEAAAALASSVEPRAVEILEQAWGVLTDPLVKRTMLGFLAGSPLSAAAEFLLSVLENASGETAAAALTALSKSRYRSQVQARLVAIVAGKGDPGLSSLFDQAFGDD